MKFACIVAAGLAGMTVSHAGATARISMVPASRFSDSDRSDARYDYDGVTATLAMPLLARDQEKDFDGYSLMLMTCRDGENPTLNFAVEGRQQIGNHSGLALATMGDAGSRKEHPVSGMIGGTEEKTLVVFQPDRDAMRDILHDMHDGGRIAFDIVQEDGAKLSLSFLSFRLSDGQKRGLSNMSKLCRP